jgi:hypothetical protein
MRLYRPSSGSEGADFQDAFCDHCARDAAFRATNYEGDPAMGCQILADTFCYNVDDPQYPKEWIVDDSGARCIAYTEDATCPTRCDNTLDMFAATPKRSEGE